MMPPGPAKDTFVVQAKHPAVLASFYRKHEHSILAAMGLMTFLGLWELHRYAVRFSPRLLFESATVATQATAIAQELPGAAEGVFEQLLDKIEHLSEEQIEELLCEERLYGI